MNWTEEALRALAPKQRIQLRANAERLGDVDLVEMIDKISAKKAVTQKAKCAGVIGFHFVCPEEYEVSYLSDGRFKSGVWKVAESQCDPAMSNGAYVALHKSRSEKSYLCGRIVGWEVEERTKGSTPTGITFLLEPISESLDWYGEGTGEKGYRYRD